MEIFIYLGVGFLILISPVTDSFAAKLLLAIFWPFVLAFVMISFPIRILQEIF